MHQPAIEVGVRWMNLDQASDPSRVDADVFTRYRSRHPRALSVSDTLAWRPWRDSHADARLAIVSNPDFNIFAPDHISLASQWRQLAGPFQLSAGLRAVRFMADRERDKAGTERELRLGASWEHWLQGGARIEVQGELRRNLATDSNSGGLELRWHWGPGRGPRDFGDDELDFRSIRSWRMPGDVSGVEQQP